MKRKRKYIIIGAAAVSVLASAVAWSTLVVADDFSVAFSQGAGVATQAERGSSVQLTDPPAAPIATTSGPVGLTGCDLMQWHRIDVGLPAYFDRIVYRESRCTADPSVRTYCCVGPLQLYVSLHLRDHRLAPRYAECGVRSERDVDGPGEDVARHYCAAKALYDVVGDDAWALTR